MGGLGGEAVPAPFGPLVLGRPGQPVPDAADRELQADAGRGVRRGEMRAQPVLGGLLAGQPAVQRERDGVQDRGLAGPGRSLEQEQAAAGQPRRSRSAASARRGRTRSAPGCAAASGGRLGVLRGLDGRLEHHAVRVLGRAATGELHEQAADLDRVTRRGQPLQVRAGPGQQRPPGRSPGPACAAISRAAAPSGADGRTASVSTTLTQAPARSRGRLRPGQEAVQGAAYLTQRPGHGRGKRGGAYLPGGVDLGQRDGLDVVLLRERERQRRARVPACTVAAPSAGRGPPARRAGGRGPRS